MRVLRRWLEARICPRAPTEMFVVCDKGEPVLVCATESAVANETASRPQRGTRVYRVPVRV